MAQSQAELESMTAEVTVEAFKTFAEDISTMFDTPVSAGQIEVTTGTVKELKDTYKKLAAVCSVKAEGAVNGQFHVVFDREGLFTIAGTFVMQPEQIITQNRQSGTEEQANEIGDALGEVGNLMVSSWDRAFQEEKAEYKHFAQSGTFIGNPWAKPEEKIGLADDEELLILTFEMTIDPLGPFRCAVLYPKSVFEPSAEEARADAESTEEQSATEVPAQETATETASGEETTTEEASTAEAATDQAAEEQAATQETPAEQAATEAASTTEATTDQAPAEEAAAQQPDAEDAPAQAEADTGQASAEEAQADEGSADEEPGDEASAPQDVDRQQDTGQQAESDDKQEATQPAQAQDQPVSDAIRKMKQSPAFLPGQFAEASAILTGLAAKDVMRVDVVWVSAEATVEQLLAKMQQHDTGYLLVGEKGNLEGIVSKSDVRGALSPYLQSMFTKWRGPMDVATLQIKAQWVMSRPVRTVRPDATLAAVMQAMSEHGGRCMPVVDEQGKIQGTVTVFDIFTALLSCGTDVPTAGRAAEAPPLV